MKPCSFKISGPVSVDALFETRVCLFRADSGAGKTLLLRKVAAYCAANKLDFMCVDNRTGLMRKPAQEIAELCSRFACVLLDNTDLYDARSVIKLLANSNVKLILAAGHNLSVLTEDCGYYSLDTVNGVLIARLERRCRASL